MLEAISEIKNERPAPVSAKGGIIVQGVHDVAVHFSKCCSPVPGDEIVGFVTRGRGVSVHRTDCVNIISLSEEERARLIDAEWSTQDGRDRDELYNAELRIYTNNRSGVLLDISRVFTENEINIGAMTVRTNKQGTATISVSFEVHGKEQLTVLISKLRGLGSVLDVERTTG